MREARVVCSGRYYVRAGNGGGCALCTGKATGCARRPHSILLRKPAHHVWCRSTRVTASAHMSTPAKCSYQSLASIAALPPVHDR